MVGNRALGRSKQRQHMLRTSNGPAFDTKALEYPNFLFQGRCDITLESWSVDRLELGKNPVHMAVPPAAATTF